MFLRKIFIVLFITLISNDFIYAIDMQETKLNSGVEQFGVASKNSYAYYKIHLLAGDRVDVELYDMDADANLYLKVGSRATINSFDCKSTHKTKYHNERCSLIIYKDSDIYISVYAFACKRTVKHHIKAIITSDPHFNSTKKKSNKSNVCQQSSQLTISNNSIKPCTVSTFHNISIYWNSPNIGTVSLEYRKIGGSWKKALSLDYKPIKSLMTYSNRYRTVKRNNVVSKGNYRGSIVNLEPNTTYEIRVNKNNSKIVMASTLNEKFKIKEVRTLFNGCQDGYKHQNKDTCIVKDSGSQEDGYLVIDGMKKNGTKRLLDLRNQKNKYNFDITNKSYIILRNFKMKGAKLHAIFIKNSHHIVVENCEISEWGDKNIKYARDGTSAIFSNSNLYASVFQRNKIFNPKYSSNSWGEINDYGGSRHPMGSQAITLTYCVKGNNIIRYNEIYSMNGNYFNDAIGGAQNWSHYGSPGADSDIYGNYIANAYDDAIEAEGGNQNVRIWNNFIEKSYVAIGNAATTVGPLYIWKNVTGEAALVGRAKPYSCTPHREYNGAFLKMGSVNLYLDNNYKIVQKNFWDKNKLTKKISTELMQGTIHLYNNTILNKGIEGYGGIGATRTCTEGSFDNRHMRNVISRNNILQVHKGVNSISKTEKKYDSSTNDYDYDMISGSVPFMVNHQYNLKREIHGLKNTIPSYKNLRIPNINISRKVGNFILKGKGIAAGECIPNFINRNIKGTVDIGAHDRFDEDMKFGINSDFNKYLKKYHQECNK